MSDSDSDVYLFGHLFGQNNRRQQPQVQSVVAYAHVSWCVSCKLSDGRIHLWCEAGWTDESILKVGLMGR